MENPVCVKVFILFCLVSRVRSYGNGAASSACVSMMPGHSVAAQNSQTPYTLSASSATYQPNQQITVTISGSNHQGLLVQARKTSGSTTPVGTFSGPSANTKLMQCSAADDSWTHSSQTVKATSTITWTAPATDVGQIVFKATVASVKITFWENHSSQTLSFMAAAETTTASNGETTTAGNGETTTASNGETTTASNGETTAASNGETTTASNGVTTTAGNGETTTTGCETVVASVCLIFISLICTMM